jgi:hypothetical protein
MIHIDNNDSYRTQIWSFFDDKVVYTHLMVLLGEDVERVVREMTSMRRAFILDARCDLSVIFDSRTSRVHEDRKIEYEDELKERDLDPVVPDRAAKVGLSHADR